MYTIYMKHAIINNLLFYLFRYSKHYFYSFFAYSFIEILIQNVGKHCVYLFDSQLCTFYKCTNNVWFSIIQILSWSLAIQNIIHTNIYLENSHLHDLLCIIQYLRIIFSCKVQCICILSNL